MPTVRASSLGGPKPQFELADGTPAVGNQLFWYVAGSVNTKQNTYTDSTGSTANANPVVLNSLGMPTTEIWLQAGLGYKVVYAPSTDTDPPTSPIFTVDNLFGINDTTGAIDQWVAFGGAPTFVSTVSFTLTGDQTTTFTVGRRIKTTNSGGTIYSTIITSVFGAVTTVTVVNDSGVLDSGLSAVSYGLLSASNLSVPQLGQVVPLSTVAGTNTITALATKAATGYQTGQYFVFIPANTNTGATTININSLGAKNIFAYGVAVGGGELIAGIPALIVYDGTQFNLSNPQPRTGSWTPIDSSGAGLSFSSAAGTYQRIGSNWRARFTLTYPATADGSAALIGGLPFTVANTTEARQGWITSTTETTALRLFPTNNATTFDIRTNAGAAITNATLSTDAVIGTIETYST